MASSVRLRRRQRPPSTMLRPAKRDACEDHPIPGVSLTVWQLGCIAGGVVAFILLLVVAFCCCRKKRKSSDWAEGMLGHWHRRKSSSDTSSYKKSTPPNEKAQSTAHASYAAMGTLPAMTFAQPAYFFQSAQQQQQQPPVVAPSQATSSVAQPDALYPRPAAAMSHASKSKPSFAKRLFGKSSSKAASVSGSKTSQRTKGSDVLPAASPTVYGSEGGSSYHSDALLSRNDGSAVAWSKGVGSSAAPSNSTGWGRSTKATGTRAKGKSGSSSVGGSSYKGPSQGPWAPSESGVGISSDFGDGSSAWNSAAPSSAQTRGAPTRTGTQYSSNAPSQGPSRLREVMKMT